MDRVKIEHQPYPMPKKRGPEPGFGKSGRKKRPDPKVKEEQDYPAGQEWRCVTCGVNEHETPLKRRGPDGKRNICNACYVRWRVKMERAERGSARPVIPLGGLTPIKTNVAALPQLPSHWNQYMLGSLPAFMPYSPFPTSSTSPISPSFIANYSAPQAAFPSYRFGSPGSANHMTQHPASAAAAAVASNFPTPVSAEFPQTSRWQHQAHSPHGGTCDSPIGDMEYPSANVPVSELHNAIWQTSMPGSVASHYALPSGYNPNMPISPVQYISSRPQYHIVTDGGPDVHAGADQAAVAAYGVNQDSMHDGSMMHKIDTQSYYQHHYDFEYIHGPKQFSDHQQQQLEYQHHLNTSAPADGYYDHRRSPPASPLPPPPENLQENHFHEEQNNQSMEQYQQSYHQQYHHMSNDELIPLSAASSSSMFTLFSADSVSSIPQHHHHHLMTAAPTDTELFPSVTGSARPLLTTAHQYHGDAAAVAVENADSCAVRLDGSPTELYNTPEGKLGLSGRDDNRGSVDTIVALSDASSTSLATMNGQEQE